MNYHFNKATPNTTFSVAILFVFKFSETMSDQYRCRVFNLILGLGVMAACRLVWLAQMNDLLPE